MEGGSLAAIFRGRPERAVETEGIEEGHQEQEADGAEDDDDEDGVDVQIDIARGEVGVEGRSSRWHSNWCSIGVEVWNYSHGSGGLEVLVYLKYKAKSTNIRVLSYSFQSNPSTTYPMFSMAFLCSA